MGRIEEFKVELEELLKKYDITLSTGDHDPEIDCHQGSKMVASWQNGSIPGRLVIY